MNKVRVLLADDHRSVLEMAARLLEPEFEVVGTVSDGESLVEIANRLNADILVTDISMPILTGIEATKQLREAGCASKVVFLTVHTDPDFLRACLATGALGYVIKARMASDLVCAIREALTGRVFISPPLAPPN